LSRWGYAALSSGLALNLVLLASQAVNSRRAVVVFTLSGPPHLHHIPSLWSAMILNEQLKGR